MDISKTFHEVGECHVAVGVLAFRPCYRMIKVDIIVACKTSYKVKNRFLWTVLEVDEPVGDHKGPGVDKRVAWNAMLVFELNE